MTVNAYKNTLSKSGFQFVEKLLYEAKTYETSMQKLEIELENVLVSLDGMYPIKATTIDDMPHGSGTSSPTENLAIKKVDNIQVKFLRSRIDEMKLNRKAIMQSMLYMTEIEKLLVKLKYDKEKKSSACWEEMHVEKSRWYEMRREIICKIANYLGIY